LTVKTNELTPKTTDYSKLSVTDKSLNKTSLLAQKNVEANPVKESNVELTRRGNTQADQRKMDDGLKDYANVSYNFGVKGNFKVVSYNFGIKGNFKVDGTALNKAGTKIKLANITESNNLNSDLYFHSIQDPWSWNLNGENIGTFTLSNVDQHNIALVLTMTKDQDFIGDVNINVSTPDSIAFMFNLPASHLKGIAADKPLVSTISTGSHSYEVTGLYNND